jgi:hypothetical protein
MSLESPLEEIRALSVRDRKHLIQLIVETLPEDAGVASSKTRKALENPRPFERGS